MIHAPELLQYSDKEKDRVFENYNISEIQFEEMVEILWEWAHKTTLPVEHLTKNMLRFGLMACKMSLEKTKLAVLGYFKTKVVYLDLYQRMVPNHNEYEKSKLLSKAAILPKLSPDLHRITVFTVNDPHAESPDGLTYAVVALMQTEMRIRCDDYFLSNVLIVDLENYNLKVFSKFTPTIIHQFIDILVSLKARLEIIHLVNLPPSVNHLMKIVNPLIPDKFLNRIKTHQSYESLHQCIPKDCLPSDFEGTLSSLEEIHESIAEYVLCRRTLPGVIQWWFCSRMGLWNYFLFSVCRHSYCIGNCWADKWCKKIESHEDYFMKLLSAKWHDPDTGREKHNEQLGVAGSFRKLCID